MSQLNTPPVDTAELLATLLLPDGSDREIAQQWLDTLGGLR